jgi:uncharacterized protein (DUF302 family)
MADDVIRIKVKSKDLNAVDEALRRSAQERKFGVLNVTDLTQKLDEKGFKYGSVCRVYDVCNPGAAHQALSSGPEISAVLPCRIALFESNGELYLATIRPAKLLAHFANPALRPMADEIEESLLAIMTAAAA